MNRLNRKKMINLLHRKILKKTQIVMKKIKAQFYNSSSQGHISIMNKD